MNRRSSVYVLTAAFAGFCFLGGRARAGESAGCRNPAWAPAPLPGFEIADCVEKDWMSMDVPLKDGVRTLRGSRSDVVYKLKNRADRVSNAAARRSYVQLGLDAGGLLASAPGAGPVSAVKRDAPEGELWYLYRHDDRSEPSTSSFTLTTVRIAPLKQEVKARTTVGAWNVRSSPCANPPWLAKAFPSFKIDGCDGRDFDKVMLNLPSGPKIVAGHVVDTSYSLSLGARSPTALAVGLNYIHALEAIGAQAASDPGNAVSFAFTQKTSQGEFWYVYQQTGGDADSLTSYRLLSVQIGGPPPGACTLEVYGIDFDTGSAVLRPDSLPVRTQLLEMMRNDPSYAAEIGGHTDDWGDPIRNRRLSGERADELKTWLTVNGIAGTRLTTVGYGASHPVAPNTSDFGRARNRRFELKRTACR